MNHRASPRFWATYRRLPEDIQRLADRCYEFLQNDSHHPSLHLKKVGSLWSVRVGLHYRALAVEDDSDLVWVWIGTHDEYDQLIADKGREPES
jgi:hypothetical protein